MAQSGMAAGGDAAQMVLFVKDDGPVIPVQLREPGSTGRAGGSGLGLAISQLLARQIGAALVLDATGPEGTIFRVTLPQEAVSAGITA